MRAFTDKNHALGQPGALLESTLRRESASGGRWQDQVEAASRGNLGDDETTTQSKINLKGSHIMKRNFSFMPKTEADATAEIRLIGAETDQIENRAKDARRELTDEETERLDFLYDRADAIMAEFPETRSNGRQTSPNAAYGTAARVGRSAGDGFKNLGEMAQAVASSSREGRTTDHRLMNAVTTYSGEGVGADGGFAVGTDFLPEIKRKVEGEDSLLAMTDQVAVSGNSVTFPKDETTPWQTSGGILAYWSAEAATMTQSKLALGDETLRLNKLTCLVPVTNELLEDAPMLDAHLRRVAGDKFVSKINSGIISGTGAGELLGILNADCLVSVEAESGQSADSLLYANLVSMYSRMYGPCRKNAVWLINQDLEPQLFQMAFPNSGSSAVFPAYLPAGGASAAPFGTLFGRPVIPMQACKTLGDKGDIILGDFSQYFTAVKAAGLRSDVSIHLWFDAGITAFRFTMRLAGQPWWASSITPENSTATLGCFITLDARA